MSVLPYSAPLQVEPLEEREYIIVQDSLVCPGSLPTIEESGGYWTIYTRPWLPDRSISYYPERFTLFVLRDHGRMLVRPIDLKRSVAGPLQFVSDDVVNCWGSGDSLDEAISDYETNLLEAYDDLVEADAPLSNLAKERLEALRRHLGPHGEECS